MKRPTVLVLALGGAVVTVAMVALAKRGSSSSTSAEPTPKPTSAPIEDYAARDLQRICDPKPRPGVEAFRAFVLEHFGGSDAGIVRACDVGGASEHKEGRAWDWSISAGSQEAIRMLAWLFAADEQGNEHSVLRRAGVMYVIHDGAIWRSYGLRQWEPYTGENLHRDHVHLSFSWLGAMGRTSFYGGGAV